MQKALIFDVYGRQVRFMLPNNQQRYKSIVGSCCTIFILGIVFIYAAYKFNLLINLEQNSFSIIQDLNWYDPDGIAFTSEEDHLKIAFGFVEMESKASQRSKAAI